MPLLELRSTSTWKRNPMTLLDVCVDAGELRRLVRDTSFMPKPRSLESERLVREKLLLNQLGESENNTAHDDESVFSSVLLGGAGTGKTLMLIEKCAAETSPFRRTLVVARLPRLVAFVKSQVREKNGFAFPTADYYTYDELLTSLTRQCQPELTSDERNFLAFNSIHFNNTTGTGAAADLSFQFTFIDEYLAKGERSTMKKQKIEPLTLWTAIRVIKSHAKVARTKKPLSREDYIGLPPTFGLDTCQRVAAYKLYVRYEEWLHSSERPLWDEADRVLYCLKYLGDVFSDEEFTSWSTRAFQWGEEGLTDSDDMPIGPYYHSVMIDESQDMSDLDISLFIRMSSGIRSMFLAADPAQSVELGIRMRDGGINDVFDTFVPQHKKGKQQVKTFLQDLRLKTNHRTHAQNLDLSQAVRSILSRSFKQPFNNENAISKGPMPESLVLKNLPEIASRFKGAMCVFICPDELVPEIRSLFLKLGISNDCFGVRDAKGLEFDIVCLINFFSTFEGRSSDGRSSASEWRNCLRWLFSKTALKTTDSSEKVHNMTLQPCDYLLSHPEIEDQLMQLYTALTRAKNRLYIIEDEETSKRARCGKGTGLGEYAFRLLKELDLMKPVKTIDAGDVEMTPQEHNARGVLLVTQAIDLANKGATTEDVIERFDMAGERFKPDKGCDSALLAQCDKTKKAILDKRDLIDMLKAKFFDHKSGKYELEAKFADVIAFEKKAAAFVEQCLFDPFVVDEVRQLGIYIEDVFYSTDYWIHFEPICAKIKACCT